MGIKSTVSMTKDMASKHIFETNIFEELKKDNLSFFLYKFFSKQAWEAISFSYSFFFAVL